MISDLPDPPIGPPFVGAIENGMGFQDIDAGSQYGLVNFNEVPGLGSPVPTDPAARFRRIDSPALDGDPLEKLGILVVSQILPESPPPDHLRTVQEGRRFGLVGEEVHEREAFRLPGRRDPVSGFTPGMLVEDHAVGVDEIGLRMLAKERRFTAQLPREQPVVRVQEADIPRVLVDEPQSGIPGAGATAVLLVCVEDLSRVFPCLSAAEVHRFVGRAVIHDDDLSPWVILGERAFDRVGKHGGAVVCGDDDQNGLAVRHRVGPQEGLRMRAR